MALLQEDPQELVRLLTYAATFPDFPKNFSPPSLTIPNYVPPNRSQPLLIYCYFMAFFTTIVVLLRLWIRKRVKGLVFGWDDWLIIPGQIFALGLIVCLILLIKIGGVGVHVYDLPLERIRKTQLLQFTGIQVYMTAIFLVRLSITLLLYRLMAHSTIKRWLLHGTVAMLAAQWIVQIFAFIFATVPISAGWDMDVRLSGFRKTVNLPLEVSILTIFYLIMDVWLLILPVHSIWTLQLSLRTRISVTWVFIFGAVACAGAVIKTLNIDNVLNSYDSTWKSFGFIAGALTEVGFGVVSSSMPALNHILIKTLPKTFESWFGSTRFASWFSTGRSTQKSFKDSFRDIRGSKTRDQSSVKPSQVELSDVSEEPPSYHSRDTARDPASPINFSRKTETREIMIEKPDFEPHDESGLYYPGWSEGQYRQRDLESNSIQPATSTDSIVTPLARDPKEDIHSKSWLHIS